MIEAGQIWKRPSVPTPTIVRILQVVGDQVLLSYNGRSRHVSKEVFLGQGFELAGHDEGLLPRKISKTAFPPMTKSGLSDEPGEG